MAEQTGINVTPTSDSGAQFELQYHKSKQAVVGVPVTEIRDASSSAVEEVLQFSFGNFLASGSFWLGIERWATMGYLDPLFLGCVSAFVCGIILSITGFRQARRRLSRLMRYIPNDDSSGSAQTRET